MKDGMKQRVGQRQLLTRHTASLPRNCLLDGEYLLLHPGEKRAAVEWFREAGVDPDWIPVNAWVEFTGDTTGHVEIIRNYERGAMSFEYEKPPNPLWFH